MSHQIQFSFDSCQNAHTQLEPMEASKIEYLAKIVNCSLSNWNYNWNILFHKTSSKQKNATKEQFIPSNTS